MGIQKPFWYSELLSVHLGPVKYALVWPHAWNFPGSPSSFLGPVICTIFRQFCSSLQKLSSHGTPLQSSRAHLVNRKLVPVKPGNWHQMQLVLSLWGVLNSCFLKFFFSLEAEILKIVIGMPRFIVLHGYSVILQIEGLRFLCKVCSNLNLLRSVLWPRIQSVLVTVPCSLVKNVLWAAAGWGAPQTSLRSQSWMGLLGAAAITDSGMLTSPTRIADFSASSFSYVSCCFICREALLLRNTIHI